MLEELQDDLKQLVELYTEVKSLILDGEAQDEEQKSNIAVFNEIRAALDHVLQCIGEDIAVAETSESLNFKKGQIRKAREHIVRAGYDSLDGIGVSIRKRISERMKGLDEISIANSFSEYFSEYVSKIKKSDEKIRESRNNRDKNNNTKENMAEYKKIVEEMKYIYDEIGINLKYIGDYDRLISDNSEFKKEIKNFSQDAISKICPQYYGDYNNLTVELGEMLKQKIFKNEGGKYNELVKKISDMQAKMRNLFPELVKYDKRIKWNNIRYWILTLAIALAVAFASQMLF